MASKRVSSLCMYVCKNVQHYCTGVALNLDGDDISGIQIRGSLLKKVSQNQTGLAMQAPSMPFYEAILLFLGGGGRPSCPRDKFLRHLELNYRGHASFVDGPVYISEPY